MATEKQEMLLLVGPWLRPGQRGQVTQMGVDRHEKTTNILLLLFATGSFLKKKFRYDKK